MVLLPPPLGPTRATLWPRPTLNETPLRTGTFLSYENVTSLNSISAPSEGSILSSTGFGRSEISLSSFRSSISCSVSGGVGGCIGQLVCIETGHTLDRLTHRLRCS